MKPLFNLFWCLLMVHSVAAQTIRPVGDTCLPHYRLSRATVSNCQINKNELAPFLIEMTLLGKSLTDGFRFNWNPNQLNGHFSTTLFASHGTTTPIAGVFQPCPGNWVYFKGRGFRKSVQNAQVVEQYRDVSFRVRYWGDIQKPDSLKLEFKSETVVGAYVTTQRDSVCGKCLATDKLVPQITGCPQSIIELPMPSDPTKVNGNDVMKQVGIKITDNCGIYNVTNYPYWTSVTNGQIIDYKTVAYDPSGNRSVCQFKVKFATAFVDTCLIRFKLTERAEPTCNGGGQPNPPFFSSELTFLGKTIKDGFYWNRFRGLLISDAILIFGKNGTQTPPAGIPFANCPGNWLYFKANGRYGQRHLGRELTDYQVRVQVFGNEHNPDSLHFDVVDYNGKEFIKHFYSSIKKDTLCNKCLATDRIAPKIHNCPTQIVPIEVKQLNNWTGRGIAELLGITATDSCELLLLDTYPDVFQPVTNGQIVDYKTVAYDKSGNRSICQFKVKPIISPLTDECRIRFDLAIRQMNTCNSEVSEIDPWLKLTLLGKRIADGFQFAGGRSLGGYVFIIAKNGQSTQPIGTQYNTCVGNWTYFTATGVPNGWSANQELVNFQVRIRHFGDERNPDSLRVEFANGQLYNSFRKDAICDKCLDPNQAPIKINNCPTQLMNYPVTTEPVYGVTVKDFARITSWDYCSIGTVMTYPSELHNAKKGQIIDYKTIVYDKNGDMSVCKFKVQLQAAPCSAYELNGPYLELCPIDITVSAAAGQNCKSVTWIPPYLSGNPSFNPVKLSCNYPQGYCFPLGKTTLTYTAKDSCGRMGTCSFVVTVNPFGAAMPLSAQVIENQWVPLVIRAINPNPTDGALLVQLKSAAEKDVTFDFYNTVGSKVYSQIQKVQNGDNELFFDLTKLPKGIYFIQTNEFGDKNALTKFVKY